ncbi:hypothetical protein ZOSMA_27G00870 [Zostera marina]|uniref:Uncharacterized protein n=1 Tax=Zostera marina TaxID=29655 RepID=A0A0K9PDA0_ZOSMR|nr:hypothetical protein ZOSMA_27G00870 [Zostera marina]
MKTLISQKKKFNPCRNLNWIHTFINGIIILLSASRFILPYINVFNDYHISNYEGNTVKEVVIIYYSLQIMLALTFLVQKLYKLASNFKELENRIYDEYCGLSDIKANQTKKLLDTIIVKCINGGEFYGLKMSLILFSADLLVSNIKDDQVWGAEILLKFADSINMIGTSSIFGILKFERLVDMLNWKNRNDQLRLTVAKIVLKFAKEKETNALRLIEIPGYLEAISSLVFSSTGDVNEINHLGLQILYTLVKKIFNFYNIIRNDRRLLEKIIDFTGDHDQKDEMAKQVSVKLLKLMKDRDIFEKWNPQSLVEEALKKLEEQQASTSQPSDA